MNLEHRLQHAARELREITIDVPPLGRPVRRRRPSLVPALAAPMLFAAGALFAVGAVRGVERPMNSDISVTSDLADNLAGNPVAEAIDEPTPVVAPAVVDPIVADPIVADPDTGADTGVAAPSIHEELQMISENLASFQANRTPEAPRSSTGSVGLRLGPI